ncbi:MAG: thioesterase [Gammaproteobacteria bacterium]|nr:MAG: thioesterase [Gammaproteobacteria bacterium]
MARIKINQPDNFIFTTEVTLRISDINYGGHMGNDAVLSIVHDARIAFLKSLGYAELDIEGLGIIMSDSAIIYKSEAFHGETLEINIGISDTHKYGMDIIYFIQEKQSQREVARVKTGILFFDYNERKVKNTPEEFVNKCNQ